MIHLKKYSEFLFERYDEEDLRDPIVRKFIENVYHYSGATEDYMKKMADKFEPFVGEFPGIFYERKPYRVYRGIKLNSPTEEEIEEIKEGIFTKKEFHQDISWTYDKATANNYAKSTKTGLLFEHTPKVSEMVFDWNFKEGQRLLRKKQLKPPIPRLDEVLLLSPVGTSYKIIKCYYQTKEVSTTELFKILRSE